MNKVDYGVAVNLYKSGLSFQEIADRYGCTASAVRAGLSSRGVISKRSSKERRTPEIEQIAYFAGLFDGEGHVTVALSRPKMQYWLQIGIVNTNRCVLEKCCASFGVGHFSEMTANSKRGGMACWAWRCTTDDAVHVLTLLSPYLIIKQNVASLAIEFQQGVKNRMSDEWKSEKMLEIRHLNATT